MCPGYYVKDAVEWKQSGSSFRYEAEQKYCSKGE